MDEGGKICNQQFDGKINLLVSDCSIEDLLVQQGILVEVFTRNTPIILKDATWRMVNPILIPFMYAICFVSMRFFVTSHSFYFGLCPLSRKACVCSWICWFSTFFMQKSVSDDAPESP